MNPVPARRNPVATALYVNAALVAALIVVLLARSDTPSLLPQALAQNQGNIAGGAGIYIMPGQFSSSAWGCYVMDVDRQTLCLYQYMPGDKNLRLVAARNFRYDRQLETYNTDPDPQFIRELVEKQANPPRRNNTEQAPVSPEAPPAGE
jgi:hypothetical protein